MKRSIRTAILAVIPVALLIGVGSAFAHEYRNGKNPERMKKFMTHRVNETLDDLDATDAQRTQILSVVNAFVDQQVAAHTSEDNSALTEAIAKAVESNNPDTREIDRLINERAERMSALAHEAVNAGKSVHAVLTAAQRTELAKEIRERAEHPHHPPPF